MKKSFSINKMRNMERTSVRETLNLNKIHPEEKKKVEQKAFSLTHEDLRKAVITAEILGKPIALRGR